MLRLADPLGSYAVLIGTAAYENLEKLPPVSNNLVRLRELLTDDDIWGLPDDRCIVVPDPAGVEQFMNPIVRAIEHVTDTLLVYYAGHGLLHPVTQDLRLTLRGSDQERTFSSLPFDYVRDVLQDHTSINKIVLLDCCYSGRAHMDAAGLEDRLVRVDGTYMMTASTANVRAMCFPNERYSAFTGELIGVLEAGLPIDGEYLGLHSLYYEVRQRLARKRRPKPEQYLRNSGALVTFARNRQFPKALPALPLRPAHLPATAAASPAVPEQFAAVVRRAPREVLAEAARMGPDRAEGLWEAVGTYAVAQGVAALLEILVHERRPSEAEFVLRGAALRSPADLVTIATVLGELGLPEAGRLLFEKSVSGLRRPGDIAAIAVVLKSSPSPQYDVQVFLSKGLLGASSADEMVDLIEALWAAGLDEEARDLVVLTADLLPPEQVTTLADRLRDGGHPRTAFGLYRRMIRPLALRPAQEVAELVGAMRTAHQADIADGLLSAVADRLGEIGDAREVLAYLEALGHEGLSEDARQLTVLLADRLALPAAIAVANGLRDLGHEEPADGIMLHHGLRKPDCDIVLLVRALRDAGRPMLAFTILRLIGEHHEPPLIPAIVTALHDGGLLSEQERVLTALVAPSTAQVRVVEALAAAYAANDRHFTTRLIRLLAEHKSVTDLASVVGDLGDVRERAFVDAALAIPAGADLGPFFHHGLALDPVAVLRTAVETSPEAVYRLLGLVRRHESDLVPWLLLQSAGLPITVLMDLVEMVSRIAEHTRELRSVLQACAQLSLDDLLALVQHLDQRGDAALIEKVVAHWLTYGGSGVAADLLAVLLDKRGFADHARRARESRSLHASKRDAHGITQAISETIKSAHLVGGPFLREPHPAEVPRPVRRQVGAAEIKLLIIFQVDMQVWAFRRGFLVLTATEVIYQRSGVQVVRVRYADFLDREIMQTTDRSLRIGEIVLSLAQSGVSNRGFVALLNTIKEIVRGGIRAGVPQSRPRLAARVATPAGRVAAPQANGLFAGAPMAAPAPAKRSGRRVPSWRRPAVPGDQPS